MLRLHPNSVRNLIRCGDLSSYLVLHRLRLPERDVLRYMQRHQAAISRRPAPRLRVRLRRRSR
jgi:hypothetical protein